MSDNSAKLVFSDKLAVSIREKIEYAVEANIVRDVDDANYHQAERTIEALERANMSTKHALNGLKKGHGYQIETHHLDKAPVQIKDRQIGETIYGENHLASYSLKDGIYQVERKDQKLLEGGAAQISGPVDPTALAASSQQLQTTNNFPKSGKTIEINAISKKTFKQLNNSDDKSLTTKSRTG